MTLQKPKAIIFDWDDTIVDAWHIIHAAINKTLTAMGSEPWSEEEGRNNIGPPAKVLFTELFGEENWEKADDIYINAYQEFIKDNIKLHQGVEDILKLANDNNIYCTVVSTKRGYLLRQEVEVLGLGKYFKAVVGTGDAEKNKPEKEPVLMAMENSGIELNPTNVWFIGDGITDILCANNSNCLPLLVETKLPSEAKLSKNPPNERFKTLVDFSDFLSKTLKKHEF